MTDRIEIYGASDDLIEIEGGIREEFTALGEADTDDGCLLAVSNGALLRVRYSRDGVWRIEPVSLPTIDGNTFELMQAPADDEDDYTDRAILTTPDRFSWVLMGSQVARRAEKERTE